jgi:hypothetical protein
MQSQYTGLFPQCTIAAAAVHHFSGTHAPPARSACTILPGVFSSPWEVSFTLGKCSFAYWNTKIHDRHAESGAFAIEIGRSSLP